MIYATLDNSGFVTGFYDTSLHGDNIPDNAVEITKEQYDELLNNQGKTALVDGYVIEKEKELSEVEANISNAFKAREYLNSTDWYVIRNIENGSAIPDEVATKRLESRVIVSDYEDNLTDLDELKNIMPEV